MEFTFDTVYNQQAMTAIARALRRTIRKKHSRRMHIFGWIVIALVLVLSLPSGGEAWAFSPRMLVSWLAALAILIVLLFEDNINGAAALSAHSVKTAFVQKPRSAQRNGSTRASGS